MCQTLLSIPDKLFGLPVFGAGLLLLVWGVASVALVTWLVWHYGLGSETRDYLPMLVISGALILFVTPLLVDADNGLPIRSYGVMMMLGVVAGVMLAVRRSPAARIDPEITFSLAFWVFAVGIFGARAFHVIQYWHRNYYNDTHPTLIAALAEIISIHKGGLVVFGSVIAVTLMIPVFAWRHRLPWLAVGDLVAPSFMLGLALGRIGCLLNGCCFGGPTDLPWAIHFPSGSIPYEDQRLRGMLDDLHVGLDSQGRVAVSQLLSSAPREAGLKTGDQIVAIDGNLDGVPVELDLRGEPVIRPLPPTSTAATGRGPAGLDRPDITGWLDDQQGILKHGRPGDRLEVARVLLRRLSLPSMSVETADGRRVAWQLPARSLAVHPTQVYSSFDALLMCLLLLAYYPFRRRDGEVAALMITIYPVTRFLIEMLRIDEAKQFGPSLTIGQVVSLAVFVGAIGLWIYLLRKPSGRLWAQSGPPPAPAVRPRPA